MNYLRKHQIDLIKSFNTNQQQIYANIYELYLVQNLFIKKYNLEVNTKSINPIKLLLNV